MHGLRSLAWCVRAVVALRRSFARTICLFEVHASGISAYLGGGAHHAARCECAAAFICIRSPHFVYIALLQALQMFKSTIKKMNSDVPRLKVITPLSGQRGSRGRRQAGARGVLLQLRDWRTDLHSHKQGDSAIFMQQHAEMRCVLFFVAVASLDDGFVLSTCLHTITVMS